jgi:hypothetical protein
MLTAKGNPDLSINNLQLRVGSAINLKTEAGLIKSIRPKKERAHHLYEYFAKRDQKAREKEEKQKASEEKKAEKRAQVEEKKKNKEKKEKELVVDDNSENGPAEDEKLRQKAEKAAKSKTSKRKNKRKRDDEDPNDNSDSDFELSDDEDKTKIKHNDLDGWLEERKAQVKNNKPGEEFHIEAAAVEIFGTTTSKRSQRTRKLSKKAQAIAEEASTTSSKVEGTPTPSKRQKTSK